MIHSFKTKDSWGGGGWADRGEFTVATISFLSVQWKFYNVTAE